MVDVMMKSVKGKLIVEYKVVINSRGRTFYPLPIDIFSTCVQIVELWDLVIVAELQCVRRLRVAILVSPLSIVMVVIVMVVMITRKDEK